MTTVSPIIDVSTLEKQVEEPKKGAFFEQTDLERREAAQEVITKRRLDETLDLVHGRHPGISLKYLACHMMGVILVVAAVWSGLSLMPQHDIMKEPHFW